MDAYLTSGSRFRSEPLDPRPRALLLVLLLAATALYLVEAGPTPFFEPDEARHAEIPREMRATGDFVTPRVNGFLAYIKPPLHYWSVAASMELFGETERAARVPSRLAAVGMVVATVLFARRRFGERVALLAGLVLATSFLLTAIGRINLTDGPMAFWVSTSAFAFAAFQEHERSGSRGRARAALYVLHVACAGAVMTKGLLGLVLPGGAILVWAALSRRLSVVPRLFAPGPLVVFLALALPWHVVIASRHEGWFDTYVVGEHFRRYFETVHHGSAPPLLYVGVLLAGFLPWSAFLGRLAASVPSVRRGEWRERGCEAYLHVFWVFTLVLLSLSRSKLPAYILPIWPVLALLLALGLERARQRGAAFQTERRAAGFLFGLLAAVAVAFAFGARYAFRFGIEVEAGFAIGFLVLGALVNLLPAGRAGPGRRSLPTERLALAVAGPWIGFVASLLFALPAVARSLTPWPFVAVLKRELRADDVLLQRGHYLQVVPFYTRRLTPLVDLPFSELDFAKEEARGRGLYLDGEEFARRWNGPARVLCVAHGRHLGDFLNPAMGLSRPRILAVSPNGKFVLLANRE